MEGPRDLEFSWSWENPSGNPYLGMENAFCPWIMKGIWAEQQESAAGPNADLEGSCCAGGPYPQDSLQPLQLT